MDQSFRSKNSLRKSIEILIKNEILDTNVSFPAKIKDYDYGTQRATIIPLTKEEFYMFGPKGDIEIKEEPYGPFPRTYEQEIPPIPDVPVQWPTANNGECYIHMPLKVGDLGMAIVSTRSLEKYLSHDWEKHVECFPLTHGDTRNHDFSDAWFIPGVLPRNKEIQIPDNAASDSMIIKNGDLVIEVDSDGKIAINNSDLNEFVDLLVDILKFIKDARYPTMMGPMNMLAMDRLNIGNYITFLETFKK